MPWKQKSFRYYTHKCVLVMIAYPTYRRGKLLILMSTPSAGALVAKVNNALYGSLDALYDKTKRKTKNVYGSLCNSKFPMLGTMKECMKIHKTLQDTQNEGAGINHFYLYNQSKT